MSTYTPIQFLTELAEVFEQPASRAEIESSLPAIRRSADSLIAACPFPLTAATLYAMHYGVLFNYSIVEATNPFVQAIQRATHQEDSLMADDRFMLILAEVARRILAGELDAPEIACPRCASK